MFLLNADHRCRPIRLSLWIAVAALCLAITPAQAAEQRGDLALIKEPLDPMLGADTCGGIFDVPAGKDVPSMRHFRHFFCTGRYTLTLDGKRGQVVTLFGDHDFKKDNGFMVIRKTDDRKVWLTDLDFIPSGRWVKRPATSDSGGVQIFYNDTANFSQEISSVKWGKWWQGRQPQ